MTPRVDAWMRQANSDWAVAELTAKQGLSQPGLLPLRPGGRKSPQGVVDFAGLTAALQPRLGTLG